jgi:hypothetical protein
MEIRTHTNQEALPVKKSRRCKRLSNHSHRALPDGQFSETSSTTAAHSSPVRTSTLPFGAHIGPVVKTVRLERVRG